MRGAWFARRLRRASFTTTHDAPRTTHGFHRIRSTNAPRNTTILTIPFAVKKADKVPGDPRPSLEERYKDHAGYVAAVAAAAANAVAQGFLLQQDADALIAQAAASNVLNP